MSKKTKINTISELKKFIKNYPDETEISFFNNRTITDLHITSKSGIGFTRDMEDETKLYFHNKKSNNQI